MKGKLNIDPGMGKTLMCVNGQFTSVEVPGMSEFG